MKKPLIPPACSYALGIALASVIQIPVPSPLLWFAFAFLLVGALIVSARSRPSTPSILILPILSAFFLLGILYYQRHAHPPSVDPPSSRAPSALRLRSYPRRSRMGKPLP
jgi:hypothetical protein